MSESRARLTASRKLSSSLCTNIRPRAANSACAKSTRVGFPFPSYRRPDSNRQPTESESAASTKGWATSAKQSVIGERLVVLLPPVVVDGLVVLRRHLRGDLLERDGSLVPAVHADVRLEQPRIFRERSVRVTVELPRSSMALVPYAHRVVAEHDALRSDGDVGHVLGPDPVLEEALVLAQHLVVVAEHEVLLAAESLHDRRRAVGVAEREVAEVVHDVAGTHARVPVVDDRLVHLVDVGERSPAVLDDVAVTEVCVAREPDLLRHDALLLSRVADGSRTHNKCALNAPPLPRLGYRDSCRRCGSSAHWTRFKRAASSLGYTGSRRAASYACPSGTSVASEVERVVRNESRRSTCSATASARQASIAAAAATARAARSK